MKEMVRMFLWTGLALLLGLKGAIPVSAREAGALDYTALRGGKSINGILSDGSVGASVTFSPGETLEIRTDSPFSWLYLQWGQVPGTYELVWEGGRMTCGENGFLHECIQLQQPVQQVKLVFSSEASLGEAAPYPPGELPAWVQRWEPPCEKADLLVFPTHADDDALYFGALISYCTKYLSWEVQTAFFTNHPTEPVRSHERLDGLWELGVRHYPVVWNAPDCYSNSLEAARRQYARYDVAGWQVEQIRRFRPEMVVGHDLNGEYGHGAHRLNAASLVEAVPPGDYNDSASNEQIESRKETYPRYDLSRISFSDFRIENELQFNPYLSLFVFMTVLCLALLWLLAKRLWKKPELAFLLVMLTLGTAMAVCLPRNKVGYDEETHLQAVMELASLPGTLHISDAVVNQLMVTDYNDPNTQPGALEEMQLFDRYLSDHGNYKSGENAPDFQVLPNRAPAYLSMALFVKLAKGLSLSWPMLILLGRLGNLLCYTGLMYAAIRKTPVGKYLMLLIGLFPQNMFLAATFSYDPFVTGCLFLGIAAWLKALWQEAGRPFDSKNAALMLGAFFLGCLPKAVYAPLLLLALLIPGNRFATARGRWLYRAAVLGLFALLIGSFILPTAVAPAETGDLRGGETSEVSQVGYILADPFGYLALLLSQMLRWLPQSFFGADCTTFMGHLVNGYTEFRGFWPLYVGLLLLYVLRGEKSSRTFSRMERIAVFLCTGAACALIWTSMYVAFTEPGAREIAGVQGRYFIPLMFLFYLFFALRRPEKEKPSPEQEGVETKGGNLARPRLLWYHLWVSIPAAALAVLL